VPIPGTTKLHRLEENIGAAGVKLTTDDLREIEDAASKIDVQGERLPEDVLGLTNR
jgi:aryl-alcohol dehydrogenase-like predicted oxidoreductase